MIDMKGTLGKRLHDQVKVKSYFYFFFKQRPHYQNTWAIMSGRNENLRKINKEKINFY